MRNFFARIQFKLRIYEASGYEFQDIVSKILEYTIPDFQKVAPWGSKGDGGNDGWDSSNNHYYQVYGPKATTQLNPVNIANKAEKDFKKLCSKYSLIRNYSFVINDRFTGIPAPLINILEQIKKDHGLDSAKVIGSAQLKDLFMGLNDDQKEMIIGFIPTDTPDFIDPRAVAELLTYLADMPSCINIELLSKLPPDFDQKIMFNGLSEYTSLLLRQGNYQVSYVDDFFNKRGIGYKQSIAEEMHQMYENSKSNIPSSDPDASDMRFFWLIDQLIPKNSRQHPHTEKAYIYAAHIILSKYFEACDIYEHPGSTNPS